MALPVLPYPPGLWTYYIFSQSRENVYKSIKYGIWTFPDPHHYVKHYSVYHRLQTSHSSKNMYYAICIREAHGTYMYGVARIVGF